MLCSVQPGLLHLRVKIPLQPMLFLGKFSDKKKIKVHQAKIQGAHMPPPLPQCQQRANMVQSDNDNLKTYSGTSSTNGVAPLIVKPLNYTQINTTCRLTHSAYNHLTTAVTACQSLQ